MRTVTTKGVTKRKWYSVNDTELRITFSSYFCLSNIAAGAHEMTLS